MAGSRRSMAGPWLGRLAFELLLIFLTVSLALVANDWWQARQHAAQARTVEAMCREEIAGNRAQVVKTLEQHRRILDRLEAAITSPQPPADLDSVREALTGGKAVDLPVLEATAWETALRTDALRHLSPRTVRRLSSIYHTQHLVDGLARSFIDRFVLDATALDPKQLPSTMRRFRVFLQVLSELETAFLRQVDRDE